MRITRAGFSLLEVLVCSILMLVLVAGSFAMIKTMNITSEDPGSYAATQQLESRRSELFVRSNYATRDTDGDPWDLDTDHAASETTVGNIEFITDHSVSAAPDPHNDGRYSGLRIATVTTTWTRRDV